MSTELKAIDGGRHTSGQGDFVFTLDSPSGRGTAVDEGFGHVHKHWYKQTISFDEGMELLERGKAETHDMTVGLPQVGHGVGNKGEYVTNIDGKSYTATPHAVAQMGTRYGTGTWYAEQLASNSFPGDGAALAHAFSHGQKKLAKTISESKRMQSEFLFRTRTDSTLRAMLTAGYTTIDNRWFLEVLSKLIPGGRLSHWKGDSDTIFGNVLIPDTIRANDDSDYGGMLSIGNCEIGTRTMYSCPSVFRSICMNGCIWGQRKGTEIKQVHRGKIDYAELENRIRVNLEKQIPLLPQGIERMLGIRAFKTDVNMKPVIAQASFDYKLSESQARKVFDAYLTEALMVPDYAKTLFGVVNAVTRAGQTMSNSEWYKFDGIGGELMGLSADGWNSLTKRAAALPPQTVDDLFAAV